MRHLQLIFLLQFQYLEVEYLLFWHFLLREIEYVIHFLKEHGRENSYIEKLKNKNPPFYGRDWKRLVHVILKHLPVTEEEWVREVKMKLPSCFWLYGNWELCQNFFYTLIFSLILRASIGESFRMSFSRANSEILLSSRIMRWSSWFFLLSLSVYETISIGSFFMDS